MVELTLEIINTIAFIALTLLAINISIRQYKFEERKQKPILYSKSLEFVKKEYIELKSEVTFGEDNCAIRIDKPEDLKVDCFSLIATNIGSSIINAIEIMDIEIIVGTEDENNSGVSKTLIAGSGDGIFNGDNKKSILLTSKIDDEVIINIPISKDYNLIKDYTHLGIKLDLNLYTINCASHKYPQKLEMWYETDENGANRISYKKCKVACE